MEHMYGLIAILITLCMMCMFCSAEECRYGSDPNCGFPCNCKSGGGCNKITGECPDGCKTGMPPGYDWGGTGCRIGNVAFNKTADQYGTHNTGLEAGKSVDGNVTTKLEAGSCSHSNSDKVIPGGGGNGWWRVDLGDTYVIDNVTIYNRDPGYERTQDFTLGIGPDKNLTSHTTCASYANDIGNGNSKTFPCNTNSKGRWFSFRRNGGGQQLPIVNFCEVIVYGYIPVDCSECPSSTSSCDDLRGCQTCPVGKKLPDCKTNCPNGYYGENCKHICGKCADSQYCDISTGVCRNGCDMWYLEPTCHTQIEKPDFTNVSISDIQRNTTSGSASIKFPLTNLPQSQRQHYNLRLRFKNKNTDKYSDGQKLKAVDGSHQELSIQNLDYNTEYDVRVMPSRIWKNQEDDGTSSKIFEVKTLCIAPEQPELDVQYENITSMELSWAEVNSGCDQVKFFAIYISYTENTTSSTRSKRQTTIVKEQHFNVSADEYVNRIYLDSDKDYQELWLEVINNQWITSESKRINITYPARLDALNAMDDNGLFIGVGIGGLVLLVLFGACIFLIWKIRRYRDSSPKTPGKKTKPQKQQKTNGAPNGHIYYNTVGMENGNTTVINETLKNNTSAEYEAVEMKEDPNKQNKEKTPKKQLNKPDAMPPKPPKGKKDKHKIEDEGDILPIAEPEERLYENARKTVIEITLLKQTLDGRQKEDFLQEEYKSLPNGMIRSCDIGRQNPNVGKNRFKNITAYDETRVILKPLNEKGEEEYINASYIPDCKGTDKVYIAGQGPKPHTVNDTWHMIWQENIERIVVVTNLVEEGKRKSECYWPERMGQPKDYGPINVTFETQQKYAGYVMRVFDMVFEGKKRRVNQFHFTSWLDKSIPVYASPLLAFRRKVRSMKRKNSPLLVHCSAGIGRTGTYIAIDAIIDKLESGDTKVDICQYVTIMRTHRMSMVQTFEQYEFIYNTVLEYYENKDTYVPTSKFFDLYDKLQHHDKAKLHAQFQKVAAFEPVQSQSPQSGMEDENVNKNRIPDLIPDDEFRPYLHQLGPNFNDYINAVFLDGYMSERAYVATQMPLADTAIDIWRLVFDHDCHTMVMLCELDKNDKTCVQYWPDKGEKKTFGPITLELLETVEKEYYTIRDIKINNSKRAKSDNRVIRHFQMTAWPNTQDLCDPRVLCTLLEELVSQQSTAGKGPILIHCLDGALRCGVVCAASIMLEQIKVDQEVDIYSCVKQVKMRRKQFISKYGQYEFLHELVKEYLQMFETYSNFR